MSADPEVTREIEPVENIVQKIGSAVCPDAWSKYDQPEYPEATS